MWWLVLLGVVMLTGSLVAVVIAAVLGNNSDRAEPRRQDRGKSNGGSPSDPNRPQGGA